MRRAADALVRSSILDGDYRTYDVCLPYALTFATPDKITKLAERGGGLSNLEAKQHWLTELKCAWGDCS